jgi:hypothetical protein
MTDPEHVKRLRQAVEVWNTWRGRAGMLLTASLRRAKGMTSPKIAAWVRIAAVIIAAAAVLESLFAICWWWGVPGWLMIATAIALASPLAYGGWWVWWRLPKWQVNRLALKIRDPKARADVEDNFRKTAGQALGGAAVLIGAGFALFQFLQQQQTTESQFLQQQKAAQDLLISNQVSKGFEQLASDKIAMRLGGIYALEGVMNTSEQYHAPALEALCAFVRENTIRKTISEKQPATDIQAALTVIGRRRGKGPEAVIDLANVSIPGADLTNANLAADLTNANLTNAKLTVARLPNAILTEAILTGANLDGADLSEANLTNAHLIGAKLLSTLLNNALLTGADLSKANLISANLDGADLSGAILNDAILIGPFSTARNLTQAQLNGACGNANTKLPNGLTIKPCQTSDPPKVP